MLTLPVVPGSSAGAVLLDQRLALAPYVCQHIRFKEGTDEQLADLGFVDLIINAMNLIRLIETVVLHDVIVFRCDRFMASVIERDPVIKPWIDAGFAGVYPTEPLRPLINHYLDGKVDSVKWNNGCNIQELLFSNVLETSLVPALDGGWELTRQTLLEWATNYPEPKRRTSKLSRSKERYFTKEQFVQSAAAATGVLATGHVSDSVLRGYNELIEHSKARMESLAALGRPTPVAIPPIAAIVLSRARTLEALGEVTLDLRGELEPFRHQLAEYDTIIRNPDASLEEAEATARKLRSGIDAVLRGRKFDIMAVCSWSDGIDLFKTWLDGLAVADAPTIAKALLGEPIRWFREKLRRRDVLYLAYLSDRFAKVESHVSILERLLHVKLYDRYFRVAAERIQNGYAPSIAAMHHVDCFFAYDRRGKEPPNGMSFTVL